MLFRKVVILSKTKDLAEFPGEKGLLGETKVSFVATDAHSASAFSFCLESASNTPLLFPCGQRPKGWGDKPPVVANNVRRP